MNARRKNYSFCMFWWMNGIRAWTLFSLLYNKDNNLLKAISIIKLLGNALAKVAIYQPSMFSSFVLLRNKTIKFYIFFYVNLFVMWKKNIDPLSELHSSCTGCIKKALREPEEYYLILHIHIWAFRLLWMWFLNVFFIEKYYIFSHQSFYLIFFHQPYINCSIIYLIFK